jgi:choline-sulfatase
MPAAKGSTPNILVIMADQLTPFLLGAYGHPVVETPNLDRLCRRGVRFDAAYSPCPICVPARASFMTGRYASRIGCHDNGDGFSSLTPTFAHYLTNQGYDTTLSGKMHFVGPDQLHGFRHRLTTDVYPATYDWSYDPIAEDVADLAFDFHKQYQAENIGPGWTLELQFDEETHYRSLEYLRQPHDRPFLLVTSFTSPHPPFIVPRQFWELYEGAEIDVPGYPTGMAETYSAMDRAINRWHGVDRNDVTSQRHLQAVRRGYYALVSYLDRKVGELLDVLEEQGFSDNTAIVFTADHGDMLGEKGMIQKRSFYEWSARVPLIIAMPDRTGAGATVDQPVSLIDVMPTLLDLANTPDADRLAMEGESLLTLMTGQADENREAISEYHAEGVFRACIMVRQGRHKFVFIEDAAPQLFDLDADPGEWTNLAANPDYAELVRRFEKMVADKFDIAAISPAIAENLKHKKIIRTAMHANGTSWDYQPRFDAAQQYMRTDATKKYLRT